MSLSFSSAVRVGIGRAFGRGSFTLQSGNFLPCARRCASRSANRQSRFVCGAHARVVRNFWNSLGVIFSGSYPDIETSLINASYPIASSQLTNFGAATPHPPDCGSDPITPLLTQRENVHSHGKDRATFLQVDNHPHLRISMWMYIHFTCYQ